MSNALSQAFENASRFRDDCYRQSGAAVKAAASAQQAFASAAFGSGGMAGITGGYDDENRRATQGYRAFRDHVFAAVRPIAVKIAELNVHVGRRKRSNEKQRVRTKGYCNNLLKKAPSFVRKGIAEADLQIIDGHPIVNAIEEPNQFSPRWHLMYNTAASIVITGR